MYNSDHMALKMNGSLLTALVAGLTVGLTAQAPAPAKPPAQAQRPDRPTFSVQVDLVTADVITRDDKGNFIADLTKDEFEVFEDGVKQDITSMTLSHGGRVTNVLAPPPPPPPEGIILPPRRQNNDVSGRIFVFFVDDLHLQFGNTGRVRQLFEKISKTLVHDGDMFGIISSGPASISVDLTYDKRRLDEAIKKMTGSELKPSEIITSGGNGQNLSELRHRAHVAFSTMAELLDNLEKVHNRRKALVYVSDGYDFNPFADSRFGALGPNSPFLQNQFLADQNPQSDDQTRTPNPNADPATRQERQNEEFSDADLARELGDLTRTANRANTTIYTIDPRGLVGAGDIDEQVDPQQWNEYIRKSQDSLRVLAEETGGVAVVNQNDFDKALKRIDAETSDYYILGYYSSNPDQLRRRRQISVKVTRKDVNVWSRKEYVLKAPPAPVSSQKQ